MINSQNPKKPSLSIQSRALHSHKKFSEIRRSYNFPNSSLNRLPLKGLIDLIPSDQILIEQYIEELKQKLQQVKTSPKRKSSRLETQQIFKRKYSEDSRNKTKTKPNDGCRKSTDQPADSYTAKKSALINFKQARDDFKRSKQMAERRVATEKENHRYSSEKIEKTASKSQPAAESCDQLRMRSNTEVLRSQKNPARFYRYSSLKKTPCIEETGMSNNYLFDKIINVHHNVNIHLGQHSPKQRLKREPAEDTPLNEVHMKPVQKSPGKRNKPKETEKIGDISTINARKETINFLGESCLQLKEQLAQQDEKQVSKILDFLGWKTNQMQKALSNVKQKKRKNCLDKLGKIFPKGFFP